MITGGQMRAARGLVNWSGADLAGASGVSLPTIRRFERHDGVPPSRTQQILKIQAALELAGVEFIGTPEEGPGVRLWRRGDN